MHRRHRGCRELRPRTLQIIPGTTVDFAVEFKNDIRPSPGEIEIFRARVVVTGNGVTDLDARNVYIVVPPEGVSGPLF